MKYSEFEIVPGYCKKGSHKVMKSYYLHSQYLPYFSVSVFTTTSMSFPGVFFVVEVRFERSFNRTILPVS